MRSADRSFGASKKPERDAVALSRHMIIKGNKPDWPYVYATSARRNEQVTYVQTSHAYGRCSAPALGNFKPRSGRTRRGSGGPMPRARSGLVTKKGKLTLSLSWPAKSDSECRGLRSFPIWPATAANQTTPIARFANWFCARAVSLSKNERCADF